ncbi:MAG: hypothetical protein ACMG6H_04195, partial [Acidobacteriota bacterium]
RPIKTVAALLEPPANPAGNLQLSTSKESAGQDACEPHALPRAFGLTKRLRGGLSPSGLQSPRPRNRKNINVKRVNC